MTSDIAQWNTKVSSVLLIILQAGLIGALSSAEYGSFNADEYNMYVGVALMMLVGFGYLMAFLKMYGLGAVGFTFVLTAVCVQLNILLTALIQKDGPHTPVLSSPVLMDGNFAAAVILISFGCIIGKASPCQLIFLSIIESVIFQVNRNLIALPEFAVEDAGGTITVHLFGAYFGLAVAFVLGQPNDKKGYGSNSLISDLLSLVGTVFLWLYWPSFNGGGFVGDTTFANRCVVNTVISLCASTVTSFALSAYLSNRFVPSDVQNATLAGGVIVGSVARMDIQPVWAACLGSVGGLVSVWGYQKVQPWLQEKTGLHDSCGVHNLHGMPSVLGGIISIVAMPTVKNKESYVSNSDGDQAMNQLYCMLVTFAISIVGGVATGYFLKFSDKLIIAMYTGDMSTKSHFTDTIYWDVGDILPAGIDSSVYNKAMGNGSVKIQPTSTTNDSPA